MGVSADLYSRLLLQLLPQGLAWPRSSDTTLAKFLDAAAIEFSRIDARAASLFDAALPSATAELLPEWERVAGLPDPCLVGKVQTLQERGDALVAKLAGTGGQSVAYFIAIAADLGFDVTIDEFRPFRAGSAVAGDSLTNGDWVHTWRVNGPDATVRHFSVGLSTAGESLAEWGNELLECRLSALKPTHTVLLFAYPVPFDFFSLFANGELGGLYLPGDERSLYSDYAGTTNLITDADSVIANMHDKSGNGFHASRLAPASRPKMTLLLGSRRRAVDYDVGQSLNIPVPNLGSNVTIARARPGIGAVITSGLTISGPVNESTDHLGELIINRSLNAIELEGVRKAMRQLSGIDDEFNLAYGTAPAEIFDVYKSSALGHPRRPIFIMVHGGGWRNGDKLLEPVVSNKNQHLLPRGFTTVYGNYTLDVGTSPIDQARSICKLIAFVQAHAEEWGCNPDEIVLAGHSAGANLVMQVTANKAMRDAYGVRPWRATIAIDSAAYDVTQIMGGPHLPLYNDPWGNDPDLYYDRWVQGSPTLILDNTPPPSLLITSTTTDPGESDSNVGPYADKVIARGGIAQILHTDYDHGGTNSEFGKLGPYTDAIDAFLAEYADL